MFIDDIEAFLQSTKEETGDGRWMVPPADGVEYTVAWKKVAGASGYQVKVTLLAEGK
ncbi:MAG: hypothetical protein Q4Q26_06755 [Eubacteriales bacterium]|nr:hypothetical protein [Eubacteriales bacterium]